MVLRRLGRVPAAGCCRASAKADSTTAGRRLGPGRGAVLALLEAAERALRCVCTGRRAAAWRKRGVKWRSLTRTRPRTGLRGGGWTRAVSAAQAAQAVTVVEARAGETMLTRAATAATASAAAAAPSSSVDYYSEEGNGGDGYECSGGDGGGKGYRAVRTDWEGELGPDADSAGAWPGSPDSAAAADPVGLDWLE
jgi:hypothetical protein